MHPQTFIRYLLLLLTSFIFSNVLAAPLPQGFQPQISQSHLGEEKQLQVNEQVWCGVPGIWMYPCDWNAEDVGMHKGVFTVFLWCKWIVSTPSNLAGTFGDWEVENSGTTASSLDTTSQITSELVRNSAAVNEEPLTAEEAAVPNKPRRSSINILPTKTERAPALESCWYNGYTGQMGCTEISKGSSLSPPRIFAPPTLIIHTLSSITRTITSTITSLKDYTIGVERLPIGIYAGNACPGDCVSRSSALLVPWSFGFPEMKFGALATLGLAGVFAIFM